MLRFIDSRKMGRSQLGWLDSHFHFSFADYYNHNNINFGVLRVMNDDLVQPGTGFDMHPHENMEIISYVVQGELSHADSMKNKAALTRGQVQYMSAGTGVVHSEHNWGQDLLRFFQIWIFPDKKGHKPNYGIIASTGPRASTIGCLWPPASKIRSQRPPSRCTPTSMSTPAT